MNQVLMIVLTVVFGVGSGVTQTVTETTAATCATAKQKLEGKSNLPVGGISNSEAYRKIDCIPVRP